MNFDEFNAKSPSTLISLPINLISLKTKVEVFSSDISIVPTEISSELVVPSTRTRNLNSPKMGV